MAGYCFFPLLQIVPNVSSYVQCREFVAQYLFRCTEIFVRTFSPHPSVNCVRLHIQFTVVENIYVLECCMQFLVRIIEKRREERGRRGREEGEEG